MGDFSEFVRMIGFERIWEFERANQEDDGKAGSS